MVIDLAGILSRGVDESEEQGLILLQVALRVNELEKYP
jgi:hypothetical protein